MAQPSLARLCGDHAGVISAARHRRSVGTDAAYRQGHPFRHLPRLRSPLPSREELPGRTDAHRFYCIRCRHRRTAVARSLSGWRLVRLGSRRSRRDCGRCTGALERPIPSTNFLVEPWCSVRADCGPEIGYALHGCRLRSALGPRPGKPAMRIVVVNSHGKTR